jgi:hypothetical protein
MTHILISITEYIYKFDMVHRSRHDLLYVSEECFAYMSEECFAHTCVRQCDSCEGLGWGGINKLRQAEHYTDYYTGLYSGYALPEIITNCE